MTKNPFAQAARLALIALSFAIVMAGLPTQAFAQNAPANGAANAPTDKPAPAPAPTPAPQRYERFVKAPSGRAVYYEVFPGLPGNPVYLTVNGLLFKQEYWDPFLSKLNATGATIIRFAFSADPESLKGKSAANAPAFSIEGLPGEIEAVLNAEKLAKITLLPLSFGSVSLEFAATHPERVERVVLMAPMILPMDAYDSSGRTTRAYLEGIRAVWGESAYEVQWSLMMEPTVRSLVSSRIGTMEGYVIDGVSNEAVVDGCMQKVKATRHFDLRDYLKKPLPRIDLLLSEGEDNDIFKDQIDFWEKLGNKAKGNFVLMREVAHAAPADAPEATVLALETVLTSDGSSEHPFLQVEVSREGKLVSKSPRTK